MEALGQDYADYLKRRPPARTFIRTLGPWRVETAMDGGRPLLLIVNDGARAVQTYAYDSLFERSRDVEMLKRIPPDDAAEAGSTAPARRPVQLCV